MIKKAETTKSPAKKPAAKAAAPKKPTAPKKAVQAKAETVAHKPAVKTEAAPKKHDKATGRYIFATGRRKTAVANVRLFVGKGENQVNRKPLATYFFHELSRNAALKPFQITGLENDFWFYATINGSGINAQAHALQHGIAQALAIANPELRTQLKKNGFLTRDDRKKERKKPGLKRARRAPQWAKR